MESRIPERIAELRDELDALLRDYPGDPNYTGPRGANPPLTEELIAEFERTHGVPLPAQYRAFLIHIGNGGQWPLIRQEPFTGYGPDPWRNWDIKPAAIGEPFPHRDAWNDPSGEPIWDRNRETEPGYEEEYERQLYAWGDVYFRPALTNGAIPLRDHGCARYSWLVVTGPSAGRVWFDCRVDRLGLYPITNEDGIRVGFLDWMLLRVDASRRRLRRQQIKFPFYDP